MDSGIFINDEWPSFGIWAIEHFGGINAKCYEHIFELLLRLVPYATPTNKKE